MNRAGSGHIAVLRSNTCTDTPSRASRMAEAMPTGPPPTTTTGSRVMTPPPGRSACPGRSRRRRCGSRPSPRCRAAGSAGSSPVCRRRPSTWSPVAGISRRTRPRAPGPVAPCRRGTGEHDVAGLQRLESRQRSHAAGGRWIMSPPCGLAAAPVHGKLQPQVEQPQELVALQQRQPRTGRGECRVRLRLVELAPWSVAASRALTSLVSTSPAT